MRLLVLTAAILIVASASEPKRSAPPEDALSGISDPQTLSQLLQWSLANQDLDALHQKAEAIRRGDGDVPPPTPPGVLSADGNVGELPAEEVHHLGVADTGAALPLPLGGTGDATIRPTVQRMTPERRAELEVLSKQLMPDVVGLMREALASALDESLPVEEREAALLDLEDHASDIDNAHDLMTIGGFPSIVQLLASDVPPLQAAAAWVLGSAVQNQRELQLHVLGIPAALPSLLALARSHASAEVRAKALYALSTLLSNCAEAQAAFGAAGGAEALVSVLTGARRANEPRIVRKALALVTDLLREMRARRGGGAAVEGAPNAPDGGGGVLVDAAGAVTPAGDASADTAEGAAPLLGAWRNATELCAAVLHCLELGDLDAQEKAVQALEQLVASALLPPAGDPEALAAAATAEEECPLAEVRAALHRYRDRCDAAGAAAVGDPDAEEGAGLMGACEDLQPTVRALDEQLERMMMQRRQ